MSRTVKQKKRGSKAFDPACRNRGQCDYCHAPELDNRRRMMEYQTIMWAEVKPDVYAGDTCDQVEPRWEACAEGDMDSDVFDHPIQLDCKTFPAGTKVVISVPCCPECSQTVEMCSSDKYCDFDWSEWVLNEYS